jgi:hypothetical protein
MENKESLIKIVSQGLCEMYNQYESQGIETVYIWGSILTPDFNPITSDVDTIAIVNDQFDIELESKIQNELTIKYPEVYKFGFRLLYKSELDTGVSKGALGLIGNPALLLLDLPTWHWVCGTKLAQNDFDLPVPVYSQAIKLRYKNTNERWSDINAIGPEEVQYFVKQILRIIHLKLLQKENIPYTIFSYSLVKEIAIGTSDEELVNICLDLKANKWDFEQFKRDIHIFKQYISDLKLEVEK